MVEDWPLFIKDQQGHDHRVLQFHSLLTLKMSLLNLNLNLNLNLSLNFSLNLNLNLSLKLSLNLGTRAGLPSSR